MALTETVWREVNFGPSAVSLQATNVWYRVTDAVTGVPGAWQQGGVSQILNRAGGATGAFNILLPFDPTVSYAMDWDGGNGQYFASETIDPEIVATVPLPLWRQVGAGAAAAAIPASAAYYQVRKADGTYAITWQNTGVVAVTNRAGNPTGYFRAVLTLDPSVSYVTQWDVNSGQFTASEENDSLTGTYLPAASWWYGNMPRVQAFGGPLADQLSQLDNSTPGPNYTKYQNSGLAGDAYFDRKFRAAGYLTPIPTTSADFPYLQMLDDRWVMSELYFARGWYDQGGNSKDMDGKFTALRAWVEEKLDELVEDGIDAALNPTPNVLNNMGTAAILTTYDGTGTQTDGQGRRLDNPPPLPIYNAFGWRW